MLDGVMLLWFLLTALSLLFVVVDMALLAGFIIAYPMNWWLVSHHMKHGMMTIRSPDEPVDGGAHKRMLDSRTPREPSGSVQPKSKPAMDDDARPASTSVLIWMTILSCAIFGLGLSVSIFFGGI